MDFLAFNAYHLPALERDEARHTLILALMERAANGDLLGPTRAWSFGAPGSCAIQTPGRLIILGAPDRDACEQLAEEVAGTRFHGVTGNDEGAFWFADRAKALGAHFDEAEPQEILAIAEAPAYPGAPGKAAPVASENAELFAEWFEAFRIEAVPAFKAVLPATAGLSGTSRPMLGCSRSMSCVRKPGSSSDWPCCPEAGAPIGGAARPQSE
jgi:hypothetical protein